MYKVGDKVKLRDNLVCRRTYGGLTLWEGMYELKNRTGVVVRLRDENRHTYYYVDFGDGSVYYFSDEMLQSSVTKLEMFIRSLL